MSMTKILFVYMYEILTRIKKNAILKRMTLLRENAR